MIDFNTVIRNGGYVISFDEIKAQVLQYSGPHYNEIKDLANKLYKRGYRTQAKQFVYTVMTHLLNKDWNNYHTVLEKYGRLLISEDL